MDVSIGQFDRDLTQDYILWYNNITRCYITRLGAALGHLRSSNSSLCDVANDPDQVFTICSNNASYMEELHYMYDIPIAHPPVPRHRECARAEEDEFNAVDHNVEELPPMTQTQM